MSDYSRHKRQVQYIVSTIVSEKHHVLFVGDAQFTKDKYVKEVITVAQRLHAGRVIIVPEFRSTIGFQLRVRCPHRSLFTD